MEDSILKITDLRKDYGRVVAVDDVSLELKAGEIVGLLGPNGAGKTTTINMILGLLSQTSGKIEIFGLDSDKNRSEINAKINFAAVYAQVPSNMTVWQCLYVFGLLYSVPDLKHKIEAIIREFELEKFHDTRAGLLSSGELSRLNIAKAIINDPHLLLLDEPTASLDPSVADNIREKIIAYAEKTRSAVLWTSHNMKEIEKVCSQVHFMSHGKILLSGDPLELPRKYNKADMEELFISVAREPLTYNDAV